MVWMWMNMRDYLTFTLRYKMKVNEHERLSNFTLRYKMKVNEYERLSNFTLRYEWK